MFSKEIFARRLSNLRTASSVSQLAIASKIGVGRTSVTLLETGQRAPSVEVLCALADYFDVSLDYLVGRSDDPTRH